MGNPGEYAIVRLPPVLTGRRRFSQRNPMFGRRDLVSYAVLARAYRARQREQWLSPDKLRDLRVQRLKGLATVAVRAPFYREAFARAGLSLKDLGDEAWLQQLPVLEKETLRSRAEDLLTTEPSTLSPITTSGTTGHPLRVLRSAIDQAEVSAIWMRVQKAYGRSFFHRQVNIGSGRGVVRKGPVAVLQKLGLAKTYQLSSFAPIDEQIATLRRVKPQVITGYAIGLEVLAEALLEKGVVDVRPQLVLSGGMQLTERCRELAERAFGVPVFDIYAANEVGCLSWECPANPGTYHLNSDVQIVEVLDPAGEPVPEGERGEVVVTQLLCTAMPLLRYRIGDAIRVASKPCLCGRNLGTIGGVQGRLTTTVRAPDGRVLNNVILSSILGSHQEIKRYQVRQQRPDELLIAVVPTEKWTSDAEDSILHDFKERLGKSFRYRLIVQDDLPLAPGGKFQTIIPLKREDAASRQTNGTN